MNRYIHALHAPSACIVSRPGQEPVTEAARPRTFVPREERQTDNAPAERGIVDTPKMTYVTTKRAADALRGSRNALRQLKRATVWGVFASPEAADAYIRERGLAMVAGVVTL